MPRVELSVRDRLRSAGLRPTRQRQALGELLFCGIDRHISAEALHIEARRAGIAVSVATVYNTLNQFTQAGLLREVVVDGARTNFDTNTSNHHHFLFEDGSLMDIPAGALDVVGMPDAPEGTRVTQVDVLVRVAKI
jgi:Fur family transcriptional regulator, iron response regulator